VSSSGPRGKHLKVNRRKKKDFSFFKVLVYLMMIAAGLMVLISYYPDILFGKTTVFVPTSGEVRIDTETVNIVLLGFDRTAARDSQYSLYRPDTIMIAAVDLDGSRLALVSLPRDSFVKINGIDRYDKINHSYMYGYFRKTEAEDRHLGGIETTIKTIEDFLGGIVVHGYVIVDMDGAAEIVDSIGGVVVEVEKEVRSDYGRGDLLIAAGKQRLEGAVFMQYVRSRADNLGGERGRTERQQKAMIALFRQLFSPQGLLKLPVFFRTVNNNLDSSLSAWQMFTLGLYGLRLDFDQIEGYVFGGEGKLSNRDGQNIYYLSIDEAYRIRVIEEIFGITVEKLPVPALPGPVVAEPDPIDEDEVNPEPELVELVEPETDDELESEVPEEPNPEEDSELETDSETESIPEEEGETTPDDNFSPDEPETDEIGTSDESG
jgi:LCP family protein required for cell wall assembly